MKEYAPKNNREPFTGPGIELLNSRAIVASAAENIDMVASNRSTRLSKEQINALLQMVSEGKSNKAIQRYFSKRFKRSLGANTILRYKQKYSSKITQLANDFEFCAINEGLARRAVRVNKLKEVAEALEESILDENGDLSEFTHAKNITEYREVLKQIAQEVGDMPTMVGDITFVNMSDKELTDYVAQKMSQHKDMAVILSEKAGVRPTLETVQLIDAEGNIITNEQQ